MLSFVVRLFLCVVILVGGCCDVTVPVGQQTMSLGVWLNAPTPEPERYHNDLIHPCVRYIENGLAGSSWWMVATPYYKGRVSTENPILFKGKGGNQSTPPRQWTPTAVMEEKPNPLYAYNSDPNLYYDGDKLWVLYRPAYADYASPYDFSVFARSTTDGVHFSERKLLIANSTDSAYNGRSDNVMSPTLIKYNDTLCIYAVHHDYVPQRKFRGIAIWKNHGSGMDDCDFRLSQTVVPHIPTDFHFWHCDFFQHQETLYCIVTPELGNEILLGKSTDGVTFDFFPVPLISKKGCGATYAYKPSAQVVDGVFYLWFPKKSRFNNIRYIYQSSISWDDLNRSYPL